MLFGALSIIITFVAWRYRSVISRITRGKVFGSPDGKSAVFESDSKLWVTDSGGFREISGRMKSQGPLWSHDSQYIAFSASREGNVDVYVADMKTRKLARLTTTPGVERPIGWNEKDELMISLGGAFLLVPRSEIEKKLL